MMNRNKDPMSVLQHHDVQTLKIKWTNTSFDTIEKYYYKKKYDFRKTTSYCNILNNFHC